MKTIALPGMLGILFALSLHATPAQAIPESWVASNGGGVACSRAQPCAGFQVAHNATDPGGIMKAKLIASSRHPCGRGRWKGGR